MMKPITHSNLGIFLAQTLPVYHIVTHNTDCQITCMTVSVATFHALCIPLAFENTQEKLLQINFIIPSGILYLSRQMQGNRTMIQYSVYNILSSSMIALLITLAIAYLLGVVCVKVT